MSELEVIIEKTWASHMLHSKPGVPFLLSHTPPYLFMMNSPLFPLWILPNSFSSLSSSLEGSFSLFFFIFMIKYEAKTIYYHKKPISLPNLAPKKTIGPFF